MNKDETHSPESIEKLAKRIFTDLHQTIVSHESGSIGGDVESVHDMRVTVRRLRVALNNFAVCVLKEDRKRLQLRLEHLAAALGGVRDLDVMIAAMKASLSNRPNNERSAISALIVRLRSRRRSRLRALINYLNGEEYADFKREFPADWIKSAAQKQHSEAVAEAVAEAVDIQFKLAQMAKMTGDPEAQEVIEEEHGQAA
jgi:CHAD domain-containing protein